MIQGTAVYRLACLRLLYAYLEASYVQPEDDADVAPPQSLSTPSGQSKKSKGSKKASYGESSSDEEEEDDDDEEEDEHGSDALSDDKADEDEMDDDDDYSYESDEEDYDEDEESPDAKETISRVLREFYPLALRNICRLLSLRDAHTLTWTWNCLEALFKVFVPVLYPYLFSLTKLLLAIGFTSRVFGSIWNMPTTCSRW